MAVTVNLPSATAKPSVVRQYLEHRLTTRYEVDAAAAQELASKWKYGLGDDLRTSTPKDLTELFGPELATPMAKCIKNDLAAEKAEQVRTYRKSSRFFLVLSMLTFLGYPQWSIQCCGDMLIKGIAECRCVSRCGSDRGLRGRPTTPFGQPPREFRIGIPGAEPEWGRGDGWGSL
ncbi:hypothetical protein BP6252_11055 [Coleophoma cylindrospora]|uniref:Uncharacterized protein n=1 Tax=Coleophoma cylindrospora TaxID=1849047 RepID=A0A3D8QPE6_9HELO|nr:hypothetical protein BP6252_11055 [Coleophoma cylindrospora]